MKPVRQWQRILILSLIYCSVFAPIFFFSSRLQRLSSIERKEFAEDLVTAKFRAHDIRLEAIDQEAGEDLEEPKSVVFKDENSSSVLSCSSKNNHVSVQSGNSEGHANLARENETVRDRKLDEQFEHKLVQHNSRQEQPSPRTVQHNHPLQSQSWRATAEKVKQMKDQIVRAKAYLNLATPGSNSNLVKELKTRIKEMERLVGEATEDSDLSRSVSQKIRAMEVSLSKASHLYPDCSALADKLRAMTQNAEEQVQAQWNQESYLIQLAGRTTPKGLHCLLMQLTSEYFSLQPEGRLLPNQERSHNPNLFHYAVFSDNVLAAAVVVNSTVSSAIEPEKLVFHVVTDSLNLPAISMWFLLNPPGKATMEILNMDEFKWLPSTQKSTLTGQQSPDPRYTSALNQLRFYLPYIFPALDKIVLFDHDVVVKGDLTRLWSIEMKGKVHAAVETCRETEASARLMHMFVNFSDPFVANTFDPKACTWAFGMNLFDLQEWRRQNLTALYHKYRDLGLQRPLWKARSLPLGWLTFYNQTIALDRRWHLLGLGYDSSIRQDEIELARVIHYDGVKKPWLEIGIGNYKSYWSKHVKYDHPYLQQCNIHE